jgi:prepilin peptidase CpaA
VLCLIFFLAGGMGGGDVKLMTAIGCFAGLSALSLILPSAAICAAVFALALSIRHSRLQEMLRNVGELVLHHARRGVEKHPDLKQT